LDIYQFKNNWREVFARPDQLPPENDWLIWLLLGGRGSGKTRSGAEWIRAQVCDSGRRHIALVAPTYTDAREVMLEGESGLLNIGYPSERPHYIASRRRLEWSNGAVGHIFTSAEPDGLRGPQFDAAWADEFCAWDNIDETLSNLRLALRLGEKPQLVITTTPRPVGALKNLIQNSAVQISRARTADNSENLSSVFLKAVETAYGGTRLGRQELDGEVLEDFPNALWSRSLIDKSRKDRPDYFDKIILAIDPPMTTGVRADSCGLIVAGRKGQGRDAKVYILHDGTVQGCSPEAWALKASGLWAAWDVDYMLAEINQGGDLVRTVLQLSHPDIVIRTVYASRGKVARAEPVAALYEQGRVHHCGRFSALEDELCLMGTVHMKHSPDRADALVWAVTDLLLQTRAVPHVRKI